MPEPLDPTGSPIDVGGILLRTPGLEGYADAHLPGSAGMRGAEQVTAAFEAAFANEGLEEEESIELTATNEVDVGAAGMRSTSHDEPAIEMDVPAPAAGWGQLVLSTDEAGVINWSFAPEEPVAAADATRGTARRAYLVRRYVAPPDAGDAGGAPTRGLIGAVGRKVLKVVAFRLLDPVGAAVGDFFAGKWEAKKRPYRFRTFAADDYASNDARTLGAADWEALGQGRALLLVHGTISRAHTAFGGLPVSVVEELHRRYQGRVFAFDHHTLSEDPRQNLDWFCRHLPESQKLDLDIVCHSRGGLVSRYLAERQSALSLGSRELRVGRIVFAAAPNSGTVLADPKYMSDFVDAYTNLLNFLPDTGVVEGLEAVITIAKQLALGALRGLDGLQSMNPSGDFLRSLNDGVAGDTRYCALTADFEPTAPGFKAYAANRLTDRIFAENNDLVVPTSGVYRENGRGGFPIDERFVFGPTAGVGHTNFFLQPAVHEKLLSWLGEAVPA